MDSGTLIVLKHFASVTEAEMAREALAAAGIPAAIQNLRTPIDAVSQSVELLVSGSDRKRATEIVSGGTTGQPWRPR